MGAGWGEWAALTAETLGQRWLTRGCPPLRNVAPGGADLQGRTAVVTGPTSGIGTATACELMRRGCHGAKAVLRRSRPPAPWTSYPLPAPSPLGGRRCSARGGGSPKGAVLP